MCFYLNIKRNIDEYMTLRRQLIIVPIFFVTQHKPIGPMNIAFSHELLFGDQWEILSDRYNCIKSKQTKLLKPKDRHVIASVCSIFGIKSPTSACIIDLSVDESSSVTIYSKTNKALAQFDTSLFNDRIDTTIWPRDKRCSSRKDAAISCSISADIRRK